MIFALHSSEFDDWTKVDMISRLIVLFGVWQPILFLSSAFIMSIHLVCFFFSIKSFQLFPCQINSAVATMIFVLHSSEFDDWTKVDMISRLIVLFGVWQPILFLFSLHYVNPPGMFLFQH